MFRFMITFDTSFPMGKSPWMGKDIPKTLMGLGRALPVPHPSTFMLGMPSLWGLFTLLLSKYNNFVKENRKCFRIHSRIY